MGRFNSFEHPGDWQGVQIQVENESNQRRGVRQVLKKAVGELQLQKPYRLIKTRDGEVIEVYEN